MNDLIDQLEKDLEHFAEAARPMLGYAATAFLEVKKTLVQIVEEVKSLVDGVAATAQTAADRQAADDAHAQTLVPNITEPPVAEEHDEHRNDHAGS